MEKKLYTPEEMSEQWDDLEAAWVILDEWAMKKSGKPLMRTSTRPDDQEGLSKASRASIAIHALEGLEPSKEALQGLRDIDAGRKTTEQVVLEAIERAKPYRPGDPSTMTGEEQEQFFDGLGEAMNRLSSVNESFEEDIKRQWEGFTLDADDNLINLKQT